MVGFGSNITRDVYLIVLFCLFSPPFPAENLQNITDSLIPLNFVSQRHINVNPVPQSTSLSLLGNIFISFKVINNITRRLFSDSDSCGYFPGSNPGLLGNKSEYEGMVSQEFPSRHNDPSFFAPDDKMIYNPIDKYRQYPIINLGTLFPE